MGLSFCVLSVSDDYGLPNRTDPADVNLHLNPRAMEEEERRRQLQRQRQLQIVDTQPTSTSPNTTSSCWDTCCSSDDCDCSGAQDDFTCCLSCEGVDCDNGGDCDNGTNDGDCDCDCNCDD